MIFANCAPCFKNEMKFMQTAGLFAEGATIQQSLVVYALKSLPAFAGRVFMQKRTKPNASTFSRGHHEECNFSARRDYQFV